MSALSQACGNVVERCLGVSPGEEVLIIGDSGITITGELRGASAASGADAIVALMDERASDGAEPPRSVAAALAACDVYIAATTRSLSHTSARKHATEAGARGATMPGVTADMLARLMTVDLDRMARRSRALAGLLTRGATARVTCPLGTDLRLELNGRQGIADDGDLTAPGAFGNLPCGEAFIAPVGGEGTIVASSLASLGLSTEPAKLPVQDGRLIAAEGGLGPEFLRVLRCHGEPGTNLAELGVGANEHATLTGNVLEDEKILGTVHVAFGASADFGGTVSVPIHLDAVVADATLLIDGQPVVDTGRLLLDQSE